MSEKWKRIGGWPHEVSDRGQIRHAINKKVRKLTLRPDGYMQVTLRCPGRKNKTAPVHTFVALAFLGRRPNGYQIDHLDRDKLNNRAENLRYLHWKENLSQSGKLNHKIAGQIRQEYATGASSQQNLSVKYGVSVSQISNIVRGECW